MKEKDEDIALSRKGIKTRKAHQILAQFGSSPWTGPEVGVAVGNTAGGLAIDRAAETGAERTLDRFLKPASASPLVDHNF